MQNWKLASSGGHFIHCIIGVLRIPVQTTGLLLKADNPETAYYQNVFRFIYVFTHATEITNLDRINVAPPQFKEHFPLYIYGNLTPYIR